MKILHLEDNPHDAALVQRLIRAEWPKCEITLTAKPDECVDALGRSAFDLILSDFTLGAFNGLEALVLAKKCAPETPFIFLSGTIGEDRAIEAVRAGADDYVLKDKMKQLPNAIRRTLREHQERRRRAAAERRIREQADVLNQAHDAIVITDLDHRIIYWNNGAENVYGWRAAEALGKRPADLFQQEAAGRIAEARQATSANGAWRGELLLHNRQGHPVVVEARRTLVRDENGQPRAHLSIGTDVTDKKKLEEQLLRAQRMENIGLLAAGIAHDLNNILAPILMAAPILKEHATEPGDQKLLNMLEHSAERGASLVRQILVFAGGAAGEQKVMQLKHILREISIVVAETFPRNIQYEERLARNLWPITANATQIHQVLLNLCVNARDAMPTGGLLRISAENVVLSTTSASAIEGGRPGEHVVVQVEDTGTGIPQSVLERMWDPFYTTKERGKGTGLGLSTVRGIVAGHGGFLEVASLAGKGTTFFLYFPAAEASEESAPPASIPTLRRGEGELILVVDDEEHVRDLAATILARAGYRVLTAANGEEALEHYLQRKSDISLVVSDTQMPKMDGPTLARALRDIDPGVTIVSISGLSFDGEQLEPAMKPEHYSARFLRKPFKPDALLAAIDELLRPVR